MKIYILYFFITCLVSIIFYSKYSIIARHLKLIDNKNPNYNFNPTPTGSGFIFLIIFLLGNIFFFIFSDSFEFEYPNKYYTLVIACVTLTIISLLDDIKSIDPILRLIVQMLTIYISISTLDLNIIDLPAKLLILFSLVIWIYITNITNFLDGSDGFLGILFLTIILNILFINYISEIKTFSFTICLIMAPVTIVFLYFNKPPAKLYMGDAGSILIGFLIGFFILELLTNKYYALALALISYPLTDCSISLIKKLYKGYMPWIGLYDYYFLKPILKNRVNHKNVLIILIIFSFLNSINIYFIAKSNINMLVILSYTMSIIQILIYSNLEGKLRFLKIFK